MNDMTEQLQSELEARRQSDPQPINTGPFEAAVQDALSRRGDAAAKIEEYHAGISRLETELRGFRNALAYQERRHSALTRRILAGREFLRAIEDDMMDIG